MTGAQAPARPPAHEPDPEALRLLLPNVGDAARDALHDLSARPSMEAANRALVQLAGSRDVVLRYRATLQHEGGADGTQTER